MVTPLLAQKGWQDVVYLKNGSILRGKLVGGPEGGPVKIETVGRNLFVFPAADVEKLSREQIKPAFTYPRLHTYLLMIETGLSVGNSANYYSVGNSVNYYANREKDFTFQTFHGYRFTSLLALGLTAGVDTYNRVSLLPIGLGLRGDLRKTRLRPYYGLDAGYALDWLEHSNKPGKRQGGFFWSPGLGFKYNFNQTQALLMGLAYKQQSTSFETSFGQLTSITENKFNRILFRLGFSL